jgi:hypothetical protein
MLFHPSDVVWDNRSGRDDMTADTAAFGLRGDGWCLVAARLHFTGGAGTATCTLSVVNQDDTEEAYNCDLYEFADALGTGTDGHISIESEGWELLHAFSFRPNQRAVFSWTNPDADDMQWGIELGMIPWSAIRNA